MFCLRFFSHVRVNIRDSGYEVLPQGLSNGLGSAARSELALSLFQMAADRFLADSERFSDFTALGPVRNQAQDCLFSGGQVDVRPNGVRIRIDKLLQAECRVAGGGA